MVETDGDVVAAQVGLARGRASERSERRVSAAPLARRARRTSLRASSRHYGERNQQPATSNGEK